MLVGYDRAKRNKATSEAIEGEEQRFRNEAHNLLKAWRSRSTTIARGTFARLFDHARYSAGK